MIIDNILPKDYCYVDNILTILDFDLVSSLYHKKILQTKSIHFFKHKTLDHYILVRVSFHTVHIRDFLSLYELIDYFKLMSEDDII